MVFFYSQLSLDLYSCMVAKFMLIMVLVWLIVQVEKHKKLVWIHTRGIKYFTHTCILFESMDNISQSRVDPAPQNISILTTTSIRGIHKTATKKIVVKNEISNEINWDVKWQSSQNWEYWWRAADLWLYKVTPDLSPDDAWPEYALFPFCAWQHTYRSQPFETCNCLYTGITNYPVIIFRWQLYNQMCSNDKQGLVECTPGHLHSHIITALR